MNAQSQLSQLCTASLDGLRLLGSFCFSMRETCDIVLHEAQFEQVVQSLEEVRKGQVYTMHEAFADLD